MKTMAFVGVLLSVLLMVTVSGAINRPRRQFCSGPGDKCYASNECCSGYVCAAFDDLFGGENGLHPENPGVCMHEKDLEPCNSQTDCQNGLRCVELGAQNDKYCLARYAAKHHAHVPMSGSKSGDIGADCKDDRDCKETNDDGDRLCCQLVSFYRRKPRKMCDRVQLNSKCILN